MAVGSYQKCKQYIESHSQREEPPAKRKVYPCITITRETGAGVMSVCKELIKLLEAISEEDGIHWTYFDRKLIQKVLEDHNLPQQLREFMPEDKTNYVKSIVYEILGIHPSHLTLLYKTTETVVHLARMGKSIIVGRGSNITTAKFKNTFHVRLIAPIENRIQHVMEFTNLSRSDAYAYIKREDAARRRYLKSNYSGDVQDPHLYHLIINTGRFTYKEAAQVIVNTLIDKFPGIFMEEVFTEFFSYDQP